MLSKTLLVYLGLTFCVIFVVVLLVVLIIAILHHETKQKKQNKDNIEISIKLNFVKLLFVEFSCKVNNDDD